jgi:hypothetical protein
MRKVLPVAGALAALAIPATASANNHAVSSLSGDWTTRGSAAMTDHGVHFNATDADTATVKYYGFKGKLSDLKRLTYTARYSTDNNSGEGRDAPYLRIFFKDGKDAIYDPTANDPDGNTLSEDVDHTRNVLAGTWRYDDDCGDGILDSTESNACAGVEGTPGYGVTGAPYSRLLADHGDEQIDFVAVTAGQQFSRNVEATMTRMRVNGDEFVFGATGPKGDTGAKGETGARGAAGRDGSAGATNVIHVTEARHVTGNTIRTLRVAKTHKGGALKSATAKLRGKKLKVRGGKVRVDLRNKAVGSYNVTILAKYVRKSDGKLHTHRFTRKLSVALA